LVPNSLRVGSPSDQPEKPQHPGAEGDSRQLLCNAFIKQLPVEWRCSHCEWRCNIPVDASAAQYADSPPGQVVDAFDSHRCLTESTL